MRGEGGAVKVCIIVFTDSRLRLAGRHAYNLYLECTSRVRRRLLPYPVVGPPAFSRGASTAGVVGAPGWHQ